MKTATLNLTIIATAAGYLPLPTPWHLTAVGALVMLGFLLPELDNPPTS